MKQTSGGNNNKQNTVSQNSKSIPKSSIQKSVVSAKKNITVGGNKLNQAPKYKIDAITK
jgi:hypothetical protein